jgi:hypothetical protein
VKVEVEQQNLTRGQAWRLYTIEHLLSWIFHLNFPCGRPEREERVNSLSEVGLIQVEVKLGKEWCAPGDDLRTFLNDFAATLSQIEFPVGVSL